jgi:glutamate racemase
VSGMLAFEDQLTIGVLDSGVGGLSVLRPLVRSALSLSLKPRPRFVYLADTRRFPYGQRPAGQIQKFAAQMISWLASRYCDVAVVACHTISTADESTVFNQLPVYDLNRIGSWLELAGGKNIVVLSTPATASTGIINKSIAANHSINKVLEIGCPELASIIENGPDNLDRLNQVLDNYAKQIIETCADTVVLGCTHYPLIIEKFAQVLPKNVNIIDPAIKFAEYFFAELRLRLDEQAQAVVKSEVANSGDAEITFHVTGSPQEFERKLNTYAPELHGTVTAVTIEELEAILKLNPLDLALA